MIYIKMDNYPYNKEIFELIRAFYPKSKITESHEFINRGKFILFYIKEEEGFSFGITEIFEDGKALASSKVNLDSIEIHRNTEATIRLGVKKSLFLALEKEKKEALAWGVLTGIRPVKVLRKIKEKKIPLDEIKDILINDYMIRQDKVKLMIEIEDRQRDYIYPLDRDRYSLYIGIPFCPSRCSYCSFAALPINPYRPYVEEYIDKLIYEIKSTSQLLKAKRLNTVYIGGGTPTSIPLESLDKIINTLYKYFDTENLKEFTVEAGRPETINKEILKMLKDYKVDRISINPQTMNEKSLKAIGRNHSVDDIIKAYDLAKQVGFKTINMDLIMGLPDEDIKDVENTLNRISRLNPENLTVHTLAIKKGSKYGDGGDKKYLKDADRVEGMMDLTREYCKNNNYIPYYLYRQKQILGNLENIGYAKEGHESIYNIAIMEEKESIIGIGMGSTSKLYNPEDGSLKRVFNFKDINSYLERIEDLVHRKRKALAT